MKKILTANGDIDVWLTISENAMIKNGFSNIEKDSVFYSVSGFRNGEKIFVTFNDNGGGKISLSIESNDENLINEYKRMLSDEFKAQAQMQKPQKQQVEKNVPKNDDFIKVDSTKPSSTPIAPQKKKKGHKVTWIIVIIAILLVAIASCTAALGGDSGNEKSLEGATLNAFYLGSLDAGTVIDNNADMTVTVTYSDGSTEDVTGWTVDPAVTLQVDTPVNFTIHYKELSLPMSMTGRQPLTIGQQNALDKAHDYLEYSPFSYTGLIGQLEYEGYSTEDATFAADNCGADWNEQAAKKAQDYLDYSAFSRDGLIDQLEYEGFTPEQAEYGVSAVGY